MTDLSLAFAIGTSIVTTIFIAGGFYMLTNWRITRLEEEQEEHNDVRDRLITMETKIDILLKTKSED